MERFELVLRLTELGYIPLRTIGVEVTDQELENAVKKFQENYGAVYIEAGEIINGRSAVVDGKVGPITNKLLGLDRTCGVPDIRRAADGTEIAEARWPNDCSQELTFSYEFSKAPGLTVEETRHGIGMALAEWNVAFSSPQNGQWYEEYLAEVRRVLTNVPTQRLSSYLLWVGTVKHEVGHALGLDHTPNDPNSVMYPSMRGQWLLNATDLSNLSRVGYKKGNIRLIMKDWTSDGGSNIWARLRSLPGSTLAWSHLANGSCSQRAEQAYDTTTSWKSGTEIIVPGIEQPGPGPGTPPGEEFLDKLFETHYFDKNGVMLGKTRNIRLTF